MTAMVPRGAPAHKDENDPRLLPPALPGEELASQIADLVDRGRPAWNLGSRPDGPGRLVVPRLGLISDLAPDGTHGRYLVPRQQPRAVLRHRVALALETHHPVAVEQMQEQDRLEWRRLGAAALKDILAFAESTIAEHCGYEYEQSARDAVSRGRKLFVGLYAWPWWYFGPNGRPPPEWREHGGGLRLTAGFATWATGTLLHSGSFDGAA